jgi:hypothetical protein
VSDDRLGKPFSPGQILTGLLEAWASGAGKRIPRQEHCGGALVLVNREEANGMVNMGYRFTTPLEHLPGEGREHIRMVCTDDVSVVKNVRYGLCSRCSMVESTIRRKLKERKLAAESAARGPSRKGARRGSFDE